MQPKVCILKTDGINCDNETSFAFELCGAKTHTVHINELKTQPYLLRGYQILAISGGFSHGDDIRSGKVFANEIRAILFDELRTFVEFGRPIIGICNGFQVLTQMRLLPGTLAYNDKAHFECRWVELMPNASSCIWTQGIEGPITLPVANGEGKLVMPRRRYENIRHRQIPLRYSKNGVPTEGYPENPNGSLDAVAALCDPSGVVFGMMPHPERFNRTTQHPNWRRSKIEKPHGRAILENGVRYASQL
jgi:phosphoribosylformylglycinamidine synthase I